MIYLTGDLHGNFDYNKILTLQKRNKSRSMGLTKNDYLIILGDFGLIFSPKETTDEKKLLARLNGMPWTTLFIDGNHENFDRLLSYPEVDMFGAKVGKIAESIFHLKRGRTYTIEGKTFFTFGGGLSIDQDRRVEGVTWWRQELPTNAEIDAALGELESRQNNVDYILTHECPRRFVPLVYGKTAETIMDYESLKYKSPVAQFLDHLYETITFKRWYFGHYHVDKKMDKMSALYYDFLPLEDNDGKA